MGREARHVPLDWNHPIDWDIYAEREQIVFKPLFGGSELTEKTARWDRECAAWDRGEREDHAKGQTGSFAEWDGERPIASDYMPVWSADVAVGWQMYETTTEGTPISPVCASPEELARWLAHYNASAFGDRTASEAEWLSCICENHGMPLVMQKRADP